MKNGLDIQVCGRRKEPKGLRPVTEGVTGEIFITGLDLYYSLFSVYYN